MPFLLVRNDISKIHADAIVNSANEDLIEGSGTSKAIYDAAGEKLLKEACRKVGYCKLGKAVITEAFHLNAKYVIHAVGPIWNEGQNKEEPILYSAYMESMKLAAQYQCDSIAFPLLSSGNYGYPKDKAMKVAVSAISDFLMENDMIVYMVLYDRESVAISQKLFSSIEEYIDDHYVEDKDETFDSIELLSNIFEQRLEANWDPIFPNEWDEQDAKPSMSRKPSRGEIPKKSVSFTLGHMDDTFSQMLLRLIDERGLKDSYVYKKANIDRRHFSKIRNDINYVPNKKTVIAFSIALELSLDETKDLLLKAGFALSNSLKFDVIIRYFIEHENYNIFELNEVLFAFGQPILGE